MNLSDGISKNLRAGGADSDTQIASAISCVLEDFLYLFPARAGRAILDEYSKMPRRQKHAEWLAQVLSWNAEELTGWIARDGDEEDKRVLLDVFLWKQRHGLIERGLRVHYKFSHWPDGSYLHRYMAANGYDDLKSSAIPRPEIRISGGHRLFLGSLRQRELQRGGLVGPIDAA